MNPEDFVNLFNPTAVVFQRWNGYDDATKILFAQLATAAHNARYDWYSTRTPDFRIGQKDDDQTRGVNVARLIFNQGSISLYWNVPSIYPNSALHAGHGVAFANNALPDGVINRAPRGPGDQGRWPSDYA